MMRAAATTAVVAGTATAVSGRVSRRQAAKAEQAAPPPEDMPAEQAPPEAYAPPEAPPPPAPAVGLSPDAIEQLKSLAELKDQGVLTEEEFAAEKAKILNG